MNLIHVYIVEFILLIKKHPSPSIKPANHSLHYLHLHYLHLLLIMKDIITYTSGCYSYIYLLFIFLSYILMYILYIFITYSISKITSYNSILFNIYNIIFIKLYNILLIFFLCIFISSNYLIKSSQMVLGQNNINIIYIKIQLISYNSYFFYYIIFFAFFLFFFFVFSL
jgi:hypothetical protein